MLKPVSSASVGLCPSIFEFSKLFFLCLLMSTQQNNNVFSKKVSHQKILRLKLKRFKVKTDET